MIRLFCLNTGSCGGCDLELRAIVDAHADLGWAGTPADADAIVLTGPITLGSREAALALLREHAGLPLLVVGRCAIDGHPFGRGGVSELPDLVVRLRLEGCPPEPDAMVKAIRDAVHKGVRG